MAIRTDNPFPENLAQRPPGELVGVLARLRLLLPSQQAELTEQVQGRFNEPRALVRELIQRGWLTPYQVNQLFQDRGPQLVLGSYVILERLGEGGMGQVFKARHLTLERVVALKVIRKDRLAHVETVQRFHREIQAVAQLSHPNVVTAFDADRIGDTHFFAMEYVEGIDLGRLVKQKGPLSIEQASDYVRQAALGLQHAHERGLVHRDIKPSNLLLAKAQGTQPGSVVKLLDLGLARLAGPVEEELTDTLTHEGTLMGTPDFIAPEQARNSHLIDARADLYSLGCTLYYLLAGRVPFPADTVTEKLYKQWLEEPDPIERLRPEVPAGLAVVIRRLMAKQPADRVQSAAALAASLLPDALQRPPQAIWVNDPATPLDQPAVPAIPLTASTVSLPSATVPGARIPPAVELIRRRPWPLFAAVGGSLVLLLVVLGVFLASRGRRAGGPIGQASATSPRDRVAAAEADLKALIARFDDRKADALRLRHDFLAFQTRYADEPWAFLEAARRITRLPSPLDALKSQDIPKAEQWQTQPRHLVGVLGERRWRHWRSATCAAFSPDGQTLASAGADGVRLWEAATGREQAVLPAHPVLALAFQDDGKTLAAAGTGGKITIWDVATAKKQATVAGPDGRARLAAFAPDGRRSIWALEEGHVVFCDHAAGKRVVLPGGHTGPVFCFAFSEDGKTLATGGRDGLVKVWDLSTATETASLAGHEGPVRALAFTPGRKTLVSGGEDRCLRLWDVASQKEIEDQDGLPAAVTTLRYIADGKILAWGDAEGSVLLWSPRRNIERVMQVASHTGRVTALAYSDRDGVLVSAGADGQLRLMDVDTGKPKETPAGHTSSVFAVSFSPDARLLASGGGDHTVRVWEAASLKERAVVEGHTERVSSVVFSGDGRRLASGSWDGTVKVWQLGSSRAPETLGQHRGQVVSVAWSQDDRTLAAAASVNDRSATGKTLEFGELTLWNTSPLQQRAAVQRLHRSAVTAVAMAPSGKLGASADRNGIVKAWDWVLGRERAMMENGSPVRCLAFSPDGRFLAAGNNAGGIKFWDPAKAEPQSILNGHSDPVTGIAFSPDGRVLVSADLSGKLVVWDLDGGKQLVSWSLPGPVHGVAFASDGRHVATANGNGTVYLFRLMPYKPR